jgi:dihydrofolate reductase
VLDGKEAPDGTMVVNNAMTVNGAFEAPVPEPDGWLVLDPTATRSRWSSSWWPTRWCWGARPTRAWPQLADDPTLGSGRGPAEPHAQVRRLQEPLAWNATLLEGDLTESLTALKDRHGLLIVSGAGELTHALTSLGLVDEFWFWVSPSLWPAGPRIFDGVGPVRLELIGATTFGSGVVRLAYRPAPERAA